ncbi:thioredoxin [bacterium]|nr:thioredoxin [bacterium]
MAEDFIEVTDDNFQQEVLNSETPVLVDFWAEWCAPCKLVVPALEQLAQDYKDKIKVGKLNVDENPNTPATYGIMGIPALLLFKGGEVKENMVGALPQDQIVERVSKHL